MLAVESLVEYSAKEIDEFSKNLSKFENKKNFERSGLFLSALVNMSPDNNITLNIGNIGSKINYIGFRNKKILIINGDCGDFTGLDMNGGELRVNGRIKSLGRVLNGKIYRKNKMVYPGWTRWIKQKLKKLLIKFGQK